MAIRPEVRDEILALSREERCELAFDEPLDPEWEQPGYWRHRVSDLTR